MPHMAAAKQRQPMQPGTQPLRQACDVGRIHQFKAQMHHTAAALPQTGAQGPALDYAGWDGRIALLIAAPQRKQIARQLNRLQLQMPAANRSQQRPHGGRDGHPRPRLARRRAFRGLHGHKTRWRGLQVLQQPLKHQGQENAPRRFRIITTGQHSS
ncbi:hypothetical protein SDC9_128961 [bioreactor metagenome]|uniref:Uncharacterized protein n=1 Tax=bioreactor metagenome TaxID=1076179 RepID=A0A645CY66_9ZZZZ